MENNNVTASAKIWQSGLYHVVRDPSTAVGPGDELAWFVFISDESYGRGVIRHIYADRNHEEPISRRFLDLPLAFRRRCPDGRFDDDQGSEYLNWLSASPYITITLVRCNPVPAV